jgi:hypothetical protein
MDLPWIYHGFTCEMMDSPFIAKSLKSSAALPPPATSQRVQASKIESGKLGPKIQMSSPEFMENPNHKWRFIAGKFGKSSISMGHGFHGYVK